MNEGKKRITYQKLFWLFMVGSVFGVLLEGIFCLVNKGVWESHVISIWGPFCIIYGLAASCFYAGQVIMEKKSPVLKFFVFALVATVIEYVSGAMLKYGLNMKAWDYSNIPLNFDGLICPQMTAAWGLLGLLFAKFAVPFFDKIFDKMKSRGWKTLCTSLTVFMAINLSLTAFAVVRWAQRHNVGPEENKITVSEKVLDKAFPDSYMENRFIEWSFLDD